MTFFFVVTGNEDVYNYIKKLMAIRKYEGVFNLKKNALKMLIHIAWYLSFTSFSDTGGSGFVRYSPLRIDSIITHTAFRAIGHRLHLYAHFPLFFFAFFILKKIP